MTQIELNCDIEIDTYDDLYELYYTQIQMT